TVAQLGYLGFEVRDLAAWESFATEVLGLAVVDRNERGFALRMDGWRRRFFVTQGEADDLALLGWQVADEPALEAIARRLRDAGTTGEAGDAAARGVVRLMRFTDPAGIPSELFCGPDLAAEPFRSEVVRGGFVADDNGLGHVVVSARSQKES